MVNSKTTQSSTDQVIKAVSEEAILKVTKEIVVKFIEVGRLSPSNVSEAFQEIYRTVRDTVRS